MGCPFVTTIGIRRFSNASFNTGFMKQAVPLVLYLAVFIPGLSANAGAKMQFGFSVDYAAWNASAIVVVEEGETFDGRVTVVESLAGPLQEGEQLTVPGLKKLASDTWRTTGNVVPPSDDDKQKEEWEGKPTLIDGRRMILFLQRPNRESDREAPTISVGDRDGVWIPVQRTTRLGHSSHLKRFYPKTDHVISGIMLATTWLDDGHAYAYATSSNVRARLQKLDLNTDALKSRLRVMKATQDALDQIEQMEPSTAAAQWAGAYITGRVNHAVGYPGFTKTSSYQRLVNRRAFGVLKSFGRAAEPVYRDLLSDPRLVDLHSYAIHSLSSIGKTEQWAQNMIVRRLEKDLRMWKKTDLNEVLKWSERDVDEVSREITSFRLHQLKRTRGYIYALEEFGRAAEPLLKRIRSDQDLVFLHDDVVITLYRILRSNRETEWARDMLLDGLKQDVELLQNVDVDRLMNWQPDNETDLTRQTVDYRRHQLSRTHKYIDIINKLKLTSEEPVLRQLLSSWQQISMSHEEHVIRKIAIHFRNIRTQAERALERIKE